jgi:hypothetical protein
MWAAAARPVLLTQAVSRPNTKHEAEPMNAGVSLCITIEHERIRAWAERLGARPAMPAPENRSYPFVFTIGPLEPGLNVVTWDKLFSEFDRANVAFVYSEAALDWPPDPTYQFVSLAALPEFTASRKTTLIGRAI